MGGNIRKLRGKYQVRWTDDHGRRRSQVFERKEDATFFLSRERLRLQEVERGLQGLAPRPMTLRELGELWIENKKSVGKRSWVTDESFIRAHLVPAFGDREIASLERADIQRFKSQRKHLSENTINHLLTCLRSLLRFAHADGRLLKVPKIELCKLSRGEDDDYRWLRSADEVRRFLISAEIEGGLVFTLYATAIYTGLRAGELCGLRWSDIDFEREVVNVRRSYEGATKSGKSRRVPLLSQLAPILKRWRLQNPLDLVFPNSAGNMMARDSRPFRQTFHRVIAHAGFAPGYITAHSLRHTFASHWMMTGGDLFKLQRILGHHSITMTERYAHLAPEAFAADRDRLPHMLPNEVSAEPISLRSS